MKAFLLSLFVALCVSAQAGSGKRATILYQGKTYRDARISQFGEEKIQDLQQRGWQRGHSKHRSPTRHAKRGEAVEGCQREETSSRKSRSRQSRSRRTQQLLQSRHHPRWRRHSLPPERHHHQAPRPPKETKLVDDDEIAVRAKPTGDRFTYTTAIGAKATVRVYQVISTEK